MLHICCFSKCDAVCCQLTLHNIITKVDPESTPWLHVSPLCWGPCYANVTLLLKHRGGCIRFDVILMSDNAQLYLTLKLMYKTDPSLSYYSAFESRTPVSHKALTVLHPSNFFFFFHNLMCCPKKNTDQIFKMSNSPFMENGLSNGW